MQALIELLAGLIALLAAAALSPLGINLHSSDQGREVHRVRDCSEPATPATLAASSDETC
jgi:hypothetical protein